MNMDKREQLLLKEYEVCQSQNNSLGQQFWISFGIFMSANTVVIGGLVNNLISRSGNQLQNTNILVLVTSAGMILISLLFRLWIKRMQFQMSVLNRRMQELEETLKINENWSIQKNKLINGIDLMEKFDKREWYRLNRQQRSRIKRFFSQSKFVQPFWWKSKRWVILFVPYFLFMWIFDFIEDVLIAPFRFNKPKYVPPIGSAVISSIVFFISGLWLVIILWVVFDC